MDTKTDFKKHHEEAAAKLRELVQLGWFKTATVFALASLADQGATAEELNGANRFIEHLTKLAADEVKIIRLPVKSLKFYDQAEPEPTGGREDF